MNRREVLQNLIAVVIVVGLLPLEVLAETGKAAELESITVYKSPTCGCCSQWVRHLQGNGFKVEAINRSDMNGVKSEAGVPRQLASCHTAVIGGYVIEGHVPAMDIKRLLEEQPDVAGLAVPGMPMGSPGMEGHRKDRYEVLTFTRSGDTTTFSRY